MKCFIAFSFLLLMNLVVNLGNASAGLILTLHDTWSGVEYELSGHLSANVLDNRTATNQSYTASNGLLNPSASDLVLMGTSTSYDIYTVKLTGSVAQPFGTGGQVSTNILGSVSGDFFGFFPNWTSGTAELWLPTGYTGRAPGSGGVGGNLSASGTIDGTISSLGLTTGSSYREFKNFDLSGTNIIALSGLSINVSEVPEPASIALVGLAPLLLLRRRRR